ncbi:hypothetical protein ANN_20777 [Periplaneta americana]|uniref:Transposase n=1 Tax=Periplaneta americana TaxID=6978 RepID=A0ABQ8SDJ2_PERAM|nr:hypothetical protein ANN_20777 [Periplaneta americana]
MVAFSIEERTYIIEAYFHTERKKSVRQPTKVTEDAVEDARERMQRSPNKSVKKLTVEIGVSYGNAHKILRKKLGMFPYKVSVVQELKPPDFTARLKYCHWFEQQMTNEILNQTFYIDEAWFHLSGYVNSQNFRIWNANNPYEFIETPLHAEKIGVWAAMSRRRITGPIFFDETVNATVYREQLLQKFFEEVHDDELQKRYFQQDGATAHTAGSTINFLEEFYDTRLISTGLWPPRNPPLSMSSTLSGPTEVVPRPLVGIQGPVSVISWNSLKLVSETWMCSGIFQDNLKNATVHMGNEVHPCTYSIAVKAVVASIWKTITVSGISSAFVCQTLQYKSEPEMFTTKECRSMVRNTSRPFIVEAKRTWGFYLPASYAQIPISTSFTDAPLAKFLDAGALDQDNIRYAICTEETERSTCPQCDDRS